MKPIIILPPKTMSDDKANDQLQQEKGTITAEVLKLVEQIQLDAQRRGEETGWKKGMTDAADIVQHRQYPMQTTPMNSIDALSIISARDNKTTSIVFEKT